MKEEKLMEDEKVYLENVQEALVEIAYIDEKVSQLVNGFYVYHEQVDLFSRIDIIIKRGNPKNKEFLEQFKIKYCDGSINLMDISRYYDLYEQYKPILIGGCE